MSRNATAVDLVTFDGAEDPQGRRHAMERGADGVWSCFVEGAGAGTFYGYRVQGPWEPGRGHWFNPDLLVLDPCARAVSGKFPDPVEDHLGFHRDASTGVLLRSERSNVVRAPRCIVVEEGFDWKGDDHPRIPGDELVIYEMHVRGFTRHPSSGVKHPGTYLGVVERIPHLKELGVNAVELLPVQESFTEQRLRMKGLTNYWGYNPVALLAPESRYGTSTSPGCQVDEFRTMVRELHGAGIEVILDIVFNHTGEQDHSGPTLCFRGIDNATYYRLDSRDPSRYVDWTGCGNTLDFSRPEVVEFAVSCLCHWVRVMHVDGFRFDLAPVLGRDDAGDFRTDAPFFQAVDDEPVLRDVKLIAEPWDLHPVSADQTGRFPSRWMEWNGRFRDDVRRFVRGDSGMVGTMGWRLTGSADVFHGEHRRPSSSVNYVTCHDGFTLLDLTSHERKHNEANGEDGRDGENHNFSHGWGVEGITTDPLVCELRRRARTALMSALMLSRGTPMLLAGDEMLRTQNGNNNAYCQDDETSWLDWRELETQQPFFSFVKRLVKLRRAHPVIRCDRYLQGEDHDSDEIPDIQWMGAMLEHDETPRGPRWDDPRTGWLAYRLDGSECGHPDGRPDHDLFIVLNPDTQQRAFPVPSLRDGAHWQTILDISRPEGTEWLDPPEPLPATNAVLVAPPRSVTVLISSRP